MTAAAAESRASFGLTVTGEEARRFDRWPPSRIAELIARHAFLVIRGSQLDDDQFVALAETMGKPIEYAFGKVLNMEARVGAAESQFTHAGMALHQDAILNRNNRATYLFFKCKETPRDPGGETLLTDNRMFMQVAPRDLLDELRAARVAYRTLTTGYYDGGGGAEQSIEHPAIVRHPRTGDETLYIALDDPDDPRRNYHASVVGYSDAESRRLMTRVDAVLRRPDLLYAHVWQVGDILAFDNYLVCHGRNPFMPGQRRRLLRVVTE